MPPPLALTQAARSKSNEVLPFVSLRKQKGASSFDANTLTKQSVFASRDELAQKGVGTTNHASRKVIRTKAARSTPKAWKPVLIWPNAMLNKVAAKVADPISSGMARSRCLT